MDAVLRPPVPVVNMQVGAADGRDFYFDQNLVAPEAGDFDFTNLRARCGFRLYDSKHGGRHQATFYLTKSDLDTKHLILALRKLCCFDVDRGTATTLGAILGLWVERSCALPTCRVEWSKSSTRLSADACIKTRFARCAAHSARSDG